MIPAACSIVTFLRRPPVQGSTDKIIINFSNGRLPIYENSPLNFTYSSCSREAETKQKHPKTQPHYPKQRTHLQIHTATFHDLDLSPPPLTDN